MYVYTQHLAIKCLWKKSNKIKFALATVLGILVTHQPMELYCAQRSMSLNSSLDVHRVHRYLTIHLL